MAETATFGELLRRYRHAVEMTIEELSSVSGVSVRAIGDMERGRSHRPQHRTVQALAEALELWNRLLSRPGWTVRHLASQLADEGSRLGMLSAGDLHVDVAFAVSYRHLSVRARELFRRLALVPGPDSGVVMSAVLTKRTSVRPKTRWRNSPTSVSCSHRTRPGIACMTWSGCSHG
jgi:transcriptional regulator with XRE-family HTH domain